MKYDYEQATRQNWSWKSLTQNASQANIQLNNLICFVLKVLLHLKKSSQKKTPVIFDIAKIGLGGGPLKSLQVEKLPKLCAEEGGP